MSVSINLHARCPVLSLIHVNQCNGVSYKFVNLCFFVKVKRSAVSSNYFVSVSFCFIPCVRYSSVLCDLYTLQQ